MRRTNHAVFVFLRFALCWATCAPSAFPAELTKPDESVGGAVSNRVQPPARKFGTERELVFKEAPKPEMQAAYDPSHYAAELELVFRYPDYYSANLPINTVNTRLRRLPPEIATIVNQRFMERPNPYAEPVPDKVEHWVRTLAGRIEEKLRPSKDIIDSLCALSSFEPVPASGNTEKVLVIQVTIRDKDKDMLQRKVRALTSLIDEGLSPRCHQDYLTAVASLERHLEGLRASLAEAEDRCAEIGRNLETLNAVKNLPEEALATLIAHKHMLKVKQAGIQARLEACRKTLAASQNEQLEMIRKAAEIDLVGIEAEEEKVDEIIASRMRFTELQTELARHRKSISLGSREMDKAEKLLAQLRQAVAKNWAYPEVSEILITKRQGKLETTSSADQPWWMN